MRHRQCEIFAGNPDPGGDELFADLDGALTALEANGFDFQLAEDERFADGSSQLVWEDETDRANVSVIRTGEAGFVYLVVTAAKRIDARLVRDALADVVAFVPFETLQTDARKRLMFHPDGIEKVAIAAGERADRVSLELIRDGLEHRGARVRLHAARAAAHCRWPELIPDLEALVRTEQDDAVREAAEHALSLSRPDST